MVYPNTHKTSVSIIIFWWILTGLFLGLGLLTYLRVMLQMEITLSNFVPFLFHVYPVGTTIILGGYLCMLAVWLVYTQVHLRQGVNRTVYILGRLVRQALARLHVLQVYHRMVEELSVITKQPHPRSISSSTEVSRSEITLGSLQIKDNPLLSESPLYQAFPDLSTNQLPYPQKQYRTLEFDHFTTDFSEFPSWLDSMLSMVAGLEDDSDHQFMYGVELGEEKKEFRRRDIGVTRLHPYKIAHRPHTPNLEEFFYSFRIASSNTIAAYRDRRPKYGIRDISDLLQDFVAFKLKFQLTIHPIFCYYLPSMIRHIKSRSWARGYIEQVRSWTDLMDVPSNIYIHYLESWVYSIYALQLWNATQSHQIDLQDIQQITVSEDCIGIHYLPDTASFILESSPNGIDPSFWQMQYMDTVASDIERYLRSHPKSPRSLTI